MTREASSSGQRGGAIADSLAVSGVLVVLAVVVAVACAPALPSPTPSPSSASSAASGSGEPTPGLTLAPTPADLSARPLVWFAPLPPLPTNRGRPYVGSEDFEDLFLADALWERAASQVDVFKLYGEWVGFADTAALRRAVEGIAARDQVLAVEAGPLDPDTSCGQGIEGFAGSGSGRRLAQRIRDAGGTLGVIALDEPWFFAHVYDGPSACRWPVERIAEGVATFIAEVREEFPWVIVGDIEPTPRPVTAAGLAEWLEAYTTAVGEPPAFLHVDIDWSLADWPAETLAIEATARQHSVPFGLIYNGGSARTDASWLQQAGARVLAYEDDAGGHPDHVVFQSWMDKPDVVLPDSEATSFTALLVRYAEQRDTLGEPLAGAGTNLALGRSATATSSIEESPAGHAIDGDVDTIWNAGAGPPASIRIDLGGLVNVTAVRLLVGQDPAGQTTHVVLGAETATGSASVLGTFTGATSDSQELVLALEPAVVLRYLTVRTDLSPSWVAWREIEVTGTPVQP